MGYSPLAFDERLVLVQGTTDPNPNLLHHFEPYWKLDDDALPDSETFPTVVNRASAAYVKKPTDMALAFTSTYVEAASGSGSSLSNFSVEVPVPLSNLNRLHKVVIEYPVDRPRDMIFSVTDIHNSDPTNRVLSNREPISANIFLPGDLITDGENLGVSTTGPFPLVPTSETNTKQKTLYIYPGGDLCVVAMNRTTGMPAAVSAIRVYVEGTAAEATSGPPSTPYPHLVAPRAGFYVESPLSLENLYGCYADPVGAANQIRALQDHYQAPSCWNIATKDHALRNYVRYLYGVNHTQYAGQPVLNTISFDVVYYRGASFPSGAFETWNWEMYPAQPVKTPTPSTTYRHRNAASPALEKYGIPGNVVGTGSIYYSTAETPICDFDLAGWTAAFCQGEKMKFVPVVDFRGTAELDYKNDTAFYLGTGPAVNGWLPEDVNQHVDATTFMVAKDGAVASGAGVPGALTPTASHINSGYNPLHPTVQNVLLEITADLNRSLAPFMAGTSYLNDADYHPSVDTLGLTMNERSRTTLMVHPWIGNKWDFGQPYPVQYWNQSDFSFDDATWLKFRQANPSLPISDSELLQQYPNLVTRFVRRATYLDDHQNASAAWHEMRYQLLATLYKNMLDSFSASGTSPKLALLYQAPTPPGLGLHYGQTVTDPTWLRDYLDAGAALAEPLSQALSTQGCLSRTIFVAQTTSMYNTRYTAPIDTGASGNKDLPPTGTDPIWKELRWSDMSIAIVPNTSTSFRDFTLDLSQPAWNSTSALRGGWVYHPFIEPWYNISPQSQYYVGWGINGASQPTPNIATVSVPADTRVEWDLPSTSPPVVFSQKGRSGSTPAWSVPYGSLYDYLLHRIGVHDYTIRAELILIGGWDTTALYGHEQQIYQAINGGT